MLHSCTKLCMNGLRLPVYTPASRYTGTLSKAEARKRRCHLFDEEKRRQRSELGRIEKIEVKYQAPDEEAIMIMNRNISTPYDCARHVSESVAKMSAIALVNGKTWDMHKPFTDSCELQFVMMQSPQVNTVNTAFWRACSLMMGAVIDTAFKDEISLHLHSFPFPVIHSGSFTYDVFVDLPNWQPSGSELRAIAAVFMKLANHELPFERLEVPYNVALDMFQDNPFKSEQIPNIANKNNNKVILYRLGEHIDISKGPMVGNSGLIGRASMTAVHKLTDAPVDSLYRFQGIALPKGTQLNHFAYGILENRARKLNTASSKIWQFDTEHEKVNITASLN